MKKEPSTDDLATFDKTLEIEYFTPTKFSSQELTDLLSDYKSKQKDINAEERELYLNNFKEQFEIYKYAFNKSKEK